MLNQQQKAFVKSIFKRPRKDCPFSKIVFQTLIFKMSEQIPYFENLDQLGDGAQSLSLKAKNVKEKKDVALKQVVFINKQPKNFIYAIKKSNDIGEEEEIDQDKLNKENQEKLFLVLEMEKFIYNLKTMVDDIIKSKNQPNQQLKEMLVIQMLDGFDSFKSYNTLHREIKPLNFFSNLKGVIRHCQLGFVSGVSQSQNYNKSIKLTQFYFDLEIEKRFFRLLELDNLIILCGQCIQHGITEIYQVKGILAKFKEQKNKKFNTFQIVEIFLHLKYQQRKPPADLIKYLMRKQNNEPNFMDLVKQQAKIISYSSLKKQANESIYLEQNQLIELFEQLFNNKDYNNSFDIIFGSYGMVIANKNKKRVQDIVLKISIVEDKTKIENERLVSNSKNKSKPKLETSYLKTLQPVRVSLNREMLNQQQKAFIFNLIQKLKKYYPVTKIVFQTIILKMRQQKQFFKNLDQLGYGAQQLDLKVRSSKQSLDAALKLVNCNNQQLKNIVDALIKEYELQIKLSFNEELAKVFNCFNLKDQYVKEAEKIDQDDQNEGNQENLFLLLEMGAFMRKRKFLTKM
ncbi:hypothetical protein ABPG72_020865 [Tetrahymena utriculariae]